MGMRLDTVEITNFGPYYGTQPVSFGACRPIVVIHGDNMLGKTSFLNAIRWALYGHALDRFGKNMPLTKLVNFDASEGGVWTMSVKLSIRDDGKRYEITRAVEPKDRSMVPLTDDDFTLHLFLRENGHFEKMEEAQSQINRILPEQISRFFLFDGELLNEYEVLLADVSTQSQLVKESIEHILGVPSMLNAIVDLKQELRDAGRRLQTLARKDAAAQVYAAEAARIQAEIESAESDLATMQGHRDQLVQRQRELDESLRAVAAAEGDVQRLQELGSQIGQLRDQERDLLEQKRNKLVDAWKDLAQRAVKPHLQRLREELAVTASKAQSVAELQAKLTGLLSLGTSGRCPTCGQAVSQVDSVQLAEQVAAITGELAKHNVTDIQQHISDLRDAIQRLERIEAAGVMDTIAQIETTLVKVRVNITFLELRRDETNERLKGHDHSAISRNRREYAEVTKELGLLEKSIEDKAADVAKKQADERRVRGLIRQVSGPALARLNREVQIYEDLISLFGRGVDRLRDNLRKAVESDATSIFQQLTTNKSYKGLRINDHYGLTILDEKEREVQVRSAGAEQIVALSLIGALNKNAVRRGPIVMDTPFGRLDPRHRENVLKFIPTLAEQVTLLVHGGEIDRDRDLQSISDDIDKEWQLRFVSSRRTAITPMKEQANEQ